MDDAPITELLPRLLADVKRPGDFCASGRHALPVVRLSVDGVGLLGLPVTSSQAAALLARSGPAPYGRGADTIVDPEVRRCGQIEASAVVDDDPRWKATVADIVARAAAGLGVEGDVRAELYKLLIYQPGDFFAEHRDTEKAPGMFATLVVVLPSEFEGGELEVRHAGRAATLDLGDDDLGLARWAAFYADCQHELRPVRAGWRIALVYNLIWPKDRVSRVPDDRPTIARVVQALQAWKAGPAAPLKVVFPLSHSYTPAELAFAALKSADAAVAHVMTRACAEADCVLRLAMVSIWESGSAEPIWTKARGRWRSRYDEGEAEEYEVVEIVERTQTLDGWRRPDDTLEPMGAVPFEDEELAPPGALDDEAPDEDHFHEATGNEGCSFERTYRRAALVIWPAARELEVIHSGGREAGLAVLERFLDLGDAQRADAMARLVIEGWHRPDPERTWAAEREPRARLIALLARMSDVGALRRFLREFVAAGSFDGTEVDALAVALRRLEDADAMEVLVGIARTCTSTRFRHVARLLRACDPSTPGLVDGLRVVVSLLGTVGRDDDWRSLGSEVAARAEGLVALVEAAGRGGDADVAVTVPGAALGHPAQWPFDPVIVPAALALPASGSPAYHAAAAPLREAAMAHLRARIALPLAPPADAVRSSAGLTCDCVSCSELRTFLAHPAQTTWSVKAAQGHRSHVEHSIQRARLDLTMHTERRGSPHTLVCTKNQASYEARVAERARDLEALARLSGERSAPTMPTAPGPRKSTS